MRSAGIAAVAAVFALSGALVSTSVASPGMNHRVSFVARTRSHPAANSWCAHASSGPLVYHWPVKPFGRQHAIRGYFGDPRTLGSEPLGTDRRGSPGSFTFHNGIDVVAPVGAAVYPVVTGIAHEGSGDRVSVTTADGRTFQYYHLKPLVGPGQRVVAYRTVIGRIERRWLHVHLTEIDEFHPVNPLEPGHLEPYRDNTVPTIERLSFSTESGLRLGPRALQGTILISAEAEDAPAMPVPGHWLGFPRHTGASHVAAHHPRGQSGQA